MQIFIKIIEYTDRGITLQPYFGNRTLEKSIYIVACDRIE